MLIDINGYNLLGNMPKRRISYFSYPWKDLSVLLTGRLRKGLTQNLPCHKGMVILPFYISYRKASTFLYLMLLAMPFIIDF